MARQSGAFGTMCAVRFIVCGSPAGISKATASFGLRQLTHVGRAGRGLRRYVALPVEHSKGFVLKTQSAAFGFVQVAGLVCLDPSFRRRPAVNRGIGPLELRAI